MGTRRASIYGRNMAELLGGDLARRGVTVVSGLARGIDGVAHAAAVAAGGRTLAVLPCGIDEVYPPRHAKLASRIVEQGALVTEFAPGTVPASYASCSRIKQQRKAPEKTRTWFEKLFDADRK